MRSSSDKTIGVLNLLVGIFSLVLSYILAWQQNWLLMTLMILCALLDFFVFIMKVTD